MSDLREKIEYAKGQYRDADEWEYQMFSANQSLLEWILDTEKSLTADNARLREVDKAARKLMRFDSKQYNLHKSKGDYEHRSKDTLALLEALEQATPQEVSDE